MANGEDKTEQIEHYKYIQGKYYVTYKGGKTYPYYFNNIIIDTNPKEIDVKDKSIYQGEKLLYQVKRVLQFSQYTRIYFESGMYKTYENKTLTYINSVLENKKCKDIFSYFSEIAASTSLITEEGYNILGNQYDSMERIREDSVLASYLNRKEKKKRFKKQTLIYPFGFNESQKKAVENALYNQVSIIEGPPGTGKTQTILNILANIIMEGKSIAVVSSNNEAIRNIQQKLSKNELDFVTAHLGSSKNKLAFIENQVDFPKSFFSWSLGVEQERWKKELAEAELKLDSLLQSQRELSKLQQEYQDILTEQKHFLKRKQEQEDEILFPSIEKFNSHTIMKLWLELERSKNRISWIKRAMYFLQYGKLGKNFYKAHHLNRIAACQSLFYELKLQELQETIEKIKQEMEQCHFERVMKDYTDKAMRVFKSSLYKKYSDTYGVSKERKKYTIESLWKESDDFIKNYPVILSTTYSLKKSLSKEVLYDYVIVDEASQVDLATGVLAMSCAKNIVIVGDRKQLPNVISSETKQKAEHIFSKYEIPECYNYAKYSLLTSCYEVYQSPVSVMLREHYRCHPKIIGFCNQKFYNNELIILTEEKADKMPLLVYQTVMGNHSRNRVNERQIDVIKQEVIPNQELDPISDSIGIVTPYRNQTKRLQEEFQETSIQADTVDKFQGQEKDIIILSTVDDEITEFADDKNRLNVAVSRAVKQLIVVTDGNHSNKNSNLKDLISYIKYQQYEVVESQIHSVFDYLYKYYEKERELYLKKAKRVSNYDSENLMYVLIEEVLKEEFQQYDIAVHIPLYMIIKDTTLLTKREKTYVQNPNTHVDFLIYSKMNRQPVLCIEVDGYQYHKKGTKQAKRDEMKDGILQKYGLEYIRFLTNGSREKEKLVEKLREIEGRNMMKNNEK